MSGNIPPLGWCATCLVAYRRKRAAEVLWKGNSLCTSHLRAVLAPDLARAIAGDEEDDEPEGGEGAG